MRFSEEYLYSHRWSGHLFGKYCRECGMTYKEFLKQRSVCPRKGIFGVFFDFFRKIERQSAGRSTKEKMRFLFALKRCIRVLIKKI